MKALNTIMESYRDTLFYENEGMMAWWNDWKSRDEKARMEKTYNNGRFSHEHKTLGIKNGRWYCCMTQAALQGKGLALDS